MQELFQMMRINEKNKQSLSFASLETKRTQRPGKERGKAKGF